MPSSNSRDVGWFILRLAAGIAFLQSGLGDFSSRHLEWDAVATITCGLALILGIFVRPAALVLLAFMVALFVTRSRIELRLVRDSLVELITLVGFLVGGSGAVLSLGTAINGLKGKWYQ